MGYRNGTDRQQLTLMPMCIDDYIPEDHICRVIHAFTEQLNMIKLEFKYAECKETGSPPYNPRMMLNLYLYGYMNRTRSSRRLHAETTRNIEVMWLMEGLTPDDRTICNFRKDNGKALKEAFRAFNKMLRNLGLFGGEVTATDGSKFRADNSRNNNHNPTNLGHKISRVEAKISEYLKALDENDAKETDDESPSAEQLKAALKQLNERKGHYDALLARLETETEISTVDPDSRLMRQSGDGRALDVCYNVQTIVDAKHCLIADFDVTNCSNDLGNLENMTTGAMEVMDVETLTNLADKGFYDGQDIEKCEKNGVICLVAKQKPGGTKKSEEFTKDKFKYDSENNCYICPGGQTLPYKHTRKRGTIEFGVYMNAKACAECPLRAECTTAKRREIERASHQDTLDIVDERTQKNKELYRKRREIVEHPFGTIKAVWGYKQFLCRTLPKVKAETALACFAYNLRRVINIFKENGRNLVTVIGEMST